MPSSISVFTDQFLPETAVSLGRLVCEIQTPLQCFCPVKLQLRSEDIAAGDFIGVDELLNQTKGSKFQLNLTKLLSLSAKNEKSIHLDVSTLKTVVYYLANSDIQFAEIRRDDNVRRWIETALRVYGHIFMCVGIVTMYNTTVDQRREQTRDNTVGVTVPLTQVLGTVASIGLPNDVLDINVDGSLWRNNGNPVSFRAPGERIVAVQYRKVRFQFFSPGDIDKATLGIGHRWVVHMPDFKGEQSDEVVEAELDTEIKEDDLDGDEDAQMINIEGQEVSVIYFLSSNG
jgi:hypothetical protein